ncbi:hypothetical protein ARAM_006823 [Aspergillus rambellii]|uniref:Involucrin repeat protein n=1 Tax=Aspergillus rambellii TaxID=308745 RepID=A0A0F8U617_9EURO|nr:hypothetical protein ARAM_006823 [Aspergillus rambellii]
MPRRDDDDDYNGASGRYFPADTETKGLGLALAQRPRSHSASPPVSEKLSDEPVPRSHSRSASPDAALVQGEDDGQRSRRSSVLRSTDSPTAVPLQFRRPPTSPRMQRSPSASSPTAVPPTSPTQGRSRRPNSTEFKNSREIRPLWLVERHGASKMEAGPDEPLPSLPPSKPSSASSSVEDLTTLRDQNAWELPEFSHQIHGAADEYYAQDDVAGSQQGTPTRATFSQSHMHVPHLSRKAELGYEFHSPSELLQDPIASAELPPSPTLDILPSVEGSAVGVRDDDNGIKRDLETLPPLPDPRPSTPEDKIIRLSDTETTPTQEKMGLAPAADMPGLNQGPGFAGIVDAAVAHVPADPPYPERDILEKYQPDHVEEDETARAVTGDDMPALTDVPALTSALEDKEQHTRSFESTTPRGFASIVDAAVAAEKEVTPGEPAVPGDLPGDESKADVFVDTLEAGKDSEAELPRFETPVIPAVAEEVSEEVAKYDAEPITETTETVSEPTAKALDETTKSQPEKRVVEKAPEDSSKNTTKKNKKKKKKKGKSLDLDEQDQAPSTEIPEPEAVPEAVPEATVETVQDPLVEQVSALGEGAAFEGESVPGEPTSEHTHALDQHLAAGMSSAIEPATATDDVLPILEEVSAPGEPSLLEKEPETGVLRTDDVPEPPESMKAAEPESGQPEETEEIPADSGLSKKAKKKKKRKSKAAAEEQPTAGLADESTDQPPADITSEIVEEPQEVARIDEPIESERSIQDPVNPPADQEGAVPAEPVSQQNALETTETPLAEESTGHSLEPTEFVEAVPRADEILQSTSDVLVTEEVAPEQLDQDIVLVDQETAVLAEPVSQENAHVNTEIPLAEESTGHSLKPTEFVEAVPRADEILQSTSDVLVTEEVAPEQLDQDIVLVDQETAVLAEPVSQENALVTTETLQSTSDVPVTEEVAPEELDKDMVLVGMPLEQELLQTEAPVEGGLTAPVVEESSPEGQQTAEALVEDLKEPTAETVSEASVTAPKQEAQDTSAPVDTQVPPESNEPKEEGEAAQVEPETTLSRKASKKKKKSKRKGTAEALPETELADTPQPETLEKSEPEIEPHPALGGEELVTKEHEQIVGDSKEIPTEAQKDEAIPEPVVETTNESQPTELAEKAEGIVLEEPEENQPKKKKKNKKNRKSLNLSESQPESEPEIKPEELPQDTTTQLPETSGEVPPTPADPEEQQQQKQQDAGTKEEAAEITNDDVVLENIQSESTLPVENIETNESEPHMSKHAEIEQPSGPNAGELPQTGKKSKKNKKKKQSISLTPDESSTADIVEASEASETPTPAALSTTDAVPDATVEEEPAALKEPSTNLVQEPAEEMSVEKELPAETTSEVPDDQATSGSATQMSAAQKKKAKKDKKKKRQSMLAEETEASEPAKETALTYPPTVEGPTPQDPEVAKSVEVDQPEFVEIIAEEQSTPEQRTEEPIPEQPTEEDIKSEEPVRDETVTTEIVEPIQEEPKEVEDLSAQTNAIPSTDEPSTAIAAQVQETVQDEVPAPVAEPTPVAEQPSEPVTDIIQGLEGEEQTREIVAQAGIQQSDDQPKDETTVEAEVAQDSTMVEPKEEKETSDDAQVSAEATPETPVKEEPQPALSKKEKKKKKKKRQSVSAEGDQAGPAAEEAPAEPTPSNPQETGENLTEESSVTGLEAAHDEVKSSAKGEPQELGKDTVTQETEVLPGAPAQEEVQLITPEEQTVTEEPVPQEEVQPITPEEKTVTEEPVPQEDKVPDPVKDIDTKKDPVSEEPVTDPMESQEQDTQPKEEPQVASSKKKEKKKKKKKGQSISLDDSQPTTPTIEEPTPEQPSGEITEAVVTTEPEETPIENQDPAPEPSGSKTPAEETQELEVQEDLPPAEEVQEDLPPAEEVQTATSKKKAKKEKKKRKSVVFASEEPSEKSAEASESAVTEPVEASGSEAIESPVGPEPATKQPDREIPKELAHEDAATKPEELQDLQTLEETSQEPSASAKLDESNVVDEPKKDEEALTEGMVDPVANVPGDFPGTIEEPVSTEAFPEEPKDGHNAAELKEVSQETEESAEPEATSEPLATEPSSPTEQTTENVEPESGSSKSKKKKKKRKTLEAIGDVPITAPEPSDSKLQDETQAQVVEPTTSDVKETEPEEPMQEQASEKQEDDNEPKSSKAKRKAKKDKKRQSNIQALEEDAALNAASEDKPQDPLSPVETAPIEELSRDTIEEPMELPTGTAFAPAEDDGKENQSHDTGLHGDHDKDLTWTDNKVSSQVEQQQETPSTYPSQPEHESTEADPALVTVEQIEAPSVEADVAEDSQAPAAIELESSSDALKDLDEEILSDSIQDKQIDKTELPPDKEVGELGGEKETTDALPALDKPDAMEEAFVEEKIEEADAQTDKEIPPVCTESEPIDEDKKVGEIIPEPEIEVEATEKIEPSNEPNAETEEPEPSVLPRKLSKKQKKQQRQAQKAANLQEQAEEEIAASSEEPTIPTSLVDELSGPAASEVVEQPVVVAENVVQQVEAPVVGTTESAAVFEADTDKIEISEVPIESTAEKDEITTPAPPIPFEEPQLSNAVEISILAEPPQETPTPVQDDSEDLRPVTTKKKNKKNKKKAAIQEPQPSDTGAKIDPAAVSEQVRQHDAEEKVGELVEEPKEAPLQSTEDKDLSKADNEITLEEPAVEEEISVPPATLEEEPSPSGSLSRKESKKNKKAKKQAKKQLEVIPAPPVTDIEADEVTTDIKPADVGEDASLHVVEAQQPQDEQASHIEAPDETSAPLETTMESDPLFEAPVLKGEEVMEEAEKKGVPEPQEQEQEQEQEVLGEPVDQAVQEKELEEAKDQDTQPAGPEIEQSVSRKLSKKEKRRLKKQAAEEGPIEEPQLEPEAPDEPDVLIPEPTAEESTVLDPKQAKEDDFSPPRKLSKKEKKKKRKGDTDVDLPQQKSVQDVENASEQSPEQEQEPPVIEAIRSAGDDDTWPQIDWEKGKLDATEQASEASLEAHLAPFVPEIPGYKESAIPEALMNRPDETSGYERGEYINQQNAEADKVLNTPAADIDQETSTKELDTTLDNAEVISHKQSKVSSIFPDLERALFRRPILNQVSEAVKDGAEEETMTQEAIRNSAIQVSEAPIATVEPRGAGYIPSPSLAQDDVFGITATTQELPEESTRGRQLERHTSNDKLYDVPKARKEGDSSIQIEEEGLFGREATHRPPHHEIPLGAPLSMHEPSSLPATEAEQREDNPIPSCELRRSPSIHGRHSPVRRAWSLEEDDETETTTQAGAERGMGSPSRTPLQTISEQEADDRVEKTNKMSGSGSMVQEHGTPRLEMKPEHILPRPETPVRKFTENALGRRAWPTSEGQQLSDQADEDWEAAVRKRGPRTLSPERGLPTEMLKTPETDKPVLRPSSSGSNHSQPLRRIAHSTSGDLRAAALAAAGVIASQAPAGEHQSRPNTPQPPSRSPTDLDVEQIASSSSYDPVTDKGKRPIRNMTDVYEGWGETPSSPRSPSRPPSIRHRRSMQHLQELEFRLDQLISENRALSAARDAAEGKLRNASLARRKSDHALNSRDADLRDRESELEQLKKSVEWFQNEVTRLTEENKGLSTTNAGLIAAHAVEIQDTRQTSSRELEELRSQNERLSSDLHGRIKQEIETALAQKNTELRRLREELESARDKVKELQQQIAASMQDNVIAFRDEEYFSAASQKLCGHVQQWVLRFSKHSDHRRCRKLMELQDEKIADRFDNAILDGSDTDSYLSDRVRRRDVFMSVVMTMVWEFIFTRYLFGMDREQRQKLKSLEKQLIEVGPRNAIHRWRATTLSLLSKRPTFARQRESDTEAVALEIFDTLSRLLPPPSHVESQLLESLRKVLRVAVNLSIEMRTQLAEYIMVPPLQPEYNTNGDLARQVFFKASLMNERSGETTSNEELESQQAVVRVVLFPLVVKKGNDSGNGDDERIVCPAQVLVARPGKDRKLSTMASGDRMSLDASKSVHSIAPSSVMDMSNVI